MAGAASREPVQLTKAQARLIWLRAQRLDTAEPFGAGAAATPAAVSHLGYVQIDTINVIERCHHHILHTRIPEYRREHLHQAQSVDKTIFEYWTHALAYVPTADFRFYVRDMKRYWRRRAVWFAAVKDKDIRRVIDRIRKYGALSIRDMKDKVLLDKEHEWASRKPSKHALEAAFFRGLITVSRRAGMLKSYELTARHFGWDRLPRAASEMETREYQLDRALKSQGLVSLDSVCYLSAPTKAGIHRLIQRRVRRNELVPIQIEGSDKPLHWASPETLDSAPQDPTERVHILSPFDPLVNQRKRLQLFFDYEHRFEAYVPKIKRLLGYFVCPVLVEDRIVAALDLKTDRERQKLLVRKWIWVEKGGARRHKARIEDQLHRFERFQLAR